MKYRLANVVITGDFEYEIDLWRLHSGEKGKRPVSYDPERFPGLTMKLGSYSLIMFPKGKFNLAGVRAMEDVDAAVKEVEKVCNPYRMVIPDGAKQH